MVDGLDEDCGSLPGSGLPSIAACLPKRPPGSLRIIIVGRPDPPMPADVDADHPLRSCRIRGLETSPHAAQVTQLAQRELDEVLATDQDRHDGLGYQVLGLVTACGGGLDRRDLQQLGPRRPSRSTGCCAACSGAPSPATPTRTPPRGCSCSPTKPCASRPPTVSARIPWPVRRALHTWADGYQHRGWLADTPAYLLHSYPRMLAAAGDLDRLTALATDSRPPRPDARCYRRRRRGPSGDRCRPHPHRTCQCPDLLAALRLA